MMIQEIEKYIADHKLAWAETTLRDERYRLLKVAPVLNGDASALWEYLEKENVGRYTRKTIWTRVQHFWDWYRASNGGQGGPANAYREFRRRNARLFKNVYTRTSPAISFEECVKLLKRHPDAAFRRKALELLFSGCRFEESFTYNNGSVIGKGSKQRAVYLPELQGPEYTKGYHTFRNSLKAVGLKPHDLRKIWARKVSKNMNAWELLEAAGWSSIETSMSYINSERDTIEHVKSSVSLF